MTSSGQCHWKLDDASAAKPHSGSLRFSVGERVTCKTDKDEWSTGTIVAVRYHRLNWDEAHSVPYQVEIDEGVLVYVPEDTDELCKEIAKAWWEKLMKPQKHIYNKSMFDAPGTYMVTANTWIQSHCDRKQASPVANAMAPTIVLVVEVCISGDRVRGRVQEPAGWMSLRSTDDEKVFAVPTESAFARRFRMVNSSLFIDEPTEATACNEPSCQCNDYAQRHTMDELRGRCAGQELDQRDEHMCTALIRAVQSQWFEAVHELLQLQANANLADGLGNTALHYAVGLGNTPNTGDFVHALLQARASPDLQNQNPESALEYKSKSFAYQDKHQTALHLCAQRGLPFIARILLQARANPNVRDAQFKVPLHLALEEEQWDIFHDLVDGGADVNLGNIEIGLESTPLQDASYRGDTVAAEKLIAARAVLNTVGKSGMTALHLAVRGRHKNMVRLLIESRCDTEKAVPGTGMTASDLAKTNKLDEIMLLLQAATQASNVAAGEASKDTSMDAQTTAEP